MESRSLPVPDGLAGERADAALAKLLGFSRTFAAEVLESGGATLDGFTGLSWTPDGRIVYASRAGGHSDIWIMQADGSGGKQLTAHSGVNAQPRVSPDGRYVVFTSDRNLGNPHIWRMDLNGEEPKQLTNGTVSTCPTAVLTTSGWCTPG